MEGEPRAAPSLVRAVSVATTTVAGYEYGYTHSQSQHLAVSSRERRQVATDSGRTP